MSLRPNVAGVPRVLDESNIFVCSPARVVTLTLLLSVGLSGPVPGCSTLWPGLRLSYWHHWVPLQHSGVWWIGERYQLWVKYVPVGSSPLSLGHLVFLTYTLATSPAYFFIAICQGGADGQMVLRGHYPSF